MLIKSIKHNQFVDETVNNIKDELLNAKHFKNVSNKDIFRGDKTVEINRHQYDVVEFDNAVAGDVIKLAQFNYKLIVFHAGVDDFDAITCLDEPIQDTNVTKYVFIPASDGQRKED